MLITLTSIIFTFSGSAFSNQQDMMQVLINKAIVFDSSLPILLENGSEEEYRNYIGNLDLILREFISVADSSGETGMFLNAKKQSATSFINGKKEFAELLFDLSKSRVLLANENIPAEDALKIKKIFTIVNFFTEKNLIDNKAKIAIIKYLDTNIRRVAIPYNKSLVLDIKNPAEIKKQERLLVYSNKKEGLDIIVINNKVIKGNTEKEEPYQEDPSKKTEEKTKIIPPEIRPYQQIHKQTPQEETFLDEYIKSNNLMPDFQFENKLAKNKVTPHSIRIIFYSKNFMGSMIKNHNLFVEDYKHGQEEMCSNIDRLHPDKANTTIEWIIDETTKAAFEDFKRGGIVYNCKNCITSEIDLATIEQDDYKNIISVIEIDGKGHSCDIKMNIVNCLSDINLKLSRLHTS